METFDDFDEQLINQDVYVFRKLPNSIAESINMVSESENLDELYFWHDKDSRHSVKLAIEDRVEQLDGFISYWDRASRASSRDNESENPSSQSSSTAEMVTFMAAAFAFMALAIALGIAVNCTHSM